MVCRVIFGDAGPKKTPGAFTRLWGRNETKTGRKRSMHLRPSRRDVKDVFGVGSERRTRTYLPRPCPPGRRPAARASIRPDHPVLALSFLQGQGRVRPADHLRGAVARPMRGHGHMQCTGGDEPLAAALFPPPPPGRAVLPDRVCRQDRSRRRSRSVFAKTDRPGESFALLLEESLAHGRGDRGTPVLDVEGSWSSAMSPRPDRQTAVAPPSTVRVWPVM